MPITALLTRFSGAQRAAAGVGDFQLVDRRVVEAMRSVRDAYPFMRMMTFECGGHAIGVPYTWRQRKEGFSKNSRRRADRPRPQRAGVVHHGAGPLRARSRAF